MNAGFSLYEARVVRFNFAFPSHYRNSRAVSTIEIKKKNFRAVRSFVPCPLFILH
jgi:hypothetical protein